MTIELTYNNESLELEAITSSFQLREIFSNNLKQADNSLKFSAVFTIELANFLKTHIDRDVLCVVTENNSRLFTGYVRKNVSFQKTQINQPIALEIVSPSFILNKTVDGGLAFIGKTLAYIITSVLSKAGVTSVGSLTALGYIPQFIALNDGENFKTFITDLLFEYGYVWDFDANGVFQVYPLFNVPDVSDITQTFNGQNCLGQIQITAKDHEADAVKATYSKIEHYDDALIFSDTTNANGSYKCQQKVAKKSYFGNKEFNYLDCDSTKGEVVYIESLRSDVQADAVQVTWRASKYDLNPDNNNRDLGKQICFSAYNSDNYDHNLSKIDFYGSVFVKAETKVSARSFGEKGTKEITLKYIDSDEKAEAFTQNYTEWFRYATNNIVLKSKTDFALGSFVKVTDYGIGTYYGRIVQKVTTLREAFSYTIETLSEFVPAEVSTEQSQGNGVMSAIEGLRENAFAYTDDKITQAQLEGSPRYDVQFNASVIKKLGDGVFSPANITASARKVNGDESEQVYSGVFHIYVNGNTAEYGQPVHGSSLSLNLNDINTYVGEITSLKIVFNSASDAILIDQENIPVLSNPNAYSIVLENDYGAFMCDELGRVSAQTVRCLPHVYYGLEELPFGDTGWDYTIFPVVEGFSFEVDQSTHEVIITTEDGAVLPDSGSIGFNLFIHGSADVEERIGYTSEGGDIYIGYISDGMSVELGYISPSEDGVYTCYFSYSKLTELGLLLSEEDDPDSENYGELVLNGKKIKAKSVTADQINTQELFAQEINATNMHLSGDSTIDGKITAQDLIIKCTAGNTYSVGRTSQPWSLHPDNNAVQINKNLFMPVSGTLKLKSTYNINLVGDGKYFQLRISGERKDASGNEITDVIWSVDATSGSQSSSRDITVGEDIGGYYKLMLNISAYCSKDSSVITYSVDLNSNPQNRVLLNALLQWQ